MEFFVPIFRLFLMLCDNMLSTASGNFQLLIKMIRVDIHQAAAAQCGKFPVFDPIT